MCQRCYCERRTLRRGSRAPDEAACLCQLELMGCLHQRLTQRALQALCNAPGGLAVGFNNNAPHWKCQDTLTTFYGTLKHSKRRDDPWQQRLCHGTLSSMGVFQASTELKEFTDPETTLTSVRTQLNGRVLAWWTGSGLTDRFWLNGQVLA